VIEQLEKEYGDVCAVHPEPIQEWGSWLDLFYTDPPKYAFGFQMKILYSFLKCVQTRDSSVLITERSPVDSLEVFAKTLYEDKIMNHLEYNLYKEYVDSIAWTPTTYIYLRTDPHTCVDRIKKRARGCESGLDEQYVHKLHGYYESLMQNKSYPFQLYVVNANASKETVFAQVTRIINENIPKTGNRD
jgi:deoxyadenosine/deoxycytidine kinase